MAAYVRMKAVIAHLEQELREEKAKYKKLEARTDTFDVRGTNTFS